jgi:dephospho-CoA kinase
MRIIGLTGQARSGKDTVAEIIEYNTACSKFAFADPIKDMLFSGLGIDIGQSKDTSEFCGVSHRKLMQTLGTDWGRIMISEDIWLEVVRQKTEVVRLLSQNKGTVLVTDVRFPNEAAWVRKNGTLIHVIGRGGIQGDHSSEDGIPLIEGDVIIENNGTIEDLRKRTSRVLNKCSYSK